MLPSPPAPPTSPSKTSQPHQRVWLIFVLTVLGNLVAGAEIRPLELVLPTPNRAIFGPDPSQYYMYTNRSFEGRQSNPWQGGKYGYVRTPRRTSDGLVYTKFHEGVDIRPVSRDRSGNPLDPVRSIGTGVVVHINNAAGGSNYGRYIVIEHDWGYGKFYSLYAHLSTVSCRLGQAVRPGSTIAKMGYTGDGISRTRAHLHLELNLMLSTRFQTWHDKVVNSKNPHGKHNGWNLAGIDIAGLFLRLRREPQMTIPQLISRMGLYYKVLVPNKGTPDILKFYPWLARDMAAAKGNPSWEISLSSSGVPLAVRPSTKTVKTPTVSWVKHSPVSHSYNTRARLTGSGSSAKLTTTGMNYLKLISGDF